MTDFLLELLSEEIPARMQDKACTDFARLFADEIAKSGLAADAIETYATPRRLALIARELPDATEAVREETKGPKASAPPQAIEGFLRKTGLSRDALAERDGVLFAVVERPGRATAEVLADAIPAIVRAFPWPKSMRWGEASREAGSLRWVRPLKGIVALFGDEVVRCRVEGIESGAATVGHRFHHPGPITIGSAADYAEKLRACHVILDSAERRGLIEGGARALAEAQGLHVVPDAGLVAENAGLTEWPVPLLGHFDPAFLEVPREVIQLTMRTNQKYFACVDGDGVGALDASQASENTSGGRVLAPTLAPAFICTANIAAADGGAGVVAGNRKVLAARLADARFFWEQDLKVPLAEQAKKLDRIVFHEKLGTVADKAARVAKLARWLVEEGIVGSSSSSPLGGKEDHAQHGGGGNVAGVNPVPATTSPFVSSEVETPAAPSAAEARQTRISTSLDADGPSTTLGTNGQGRAASLADMAEQAALLCKADLVTGMVGEFPELQGVMGGYYARAEGLPAQVADAIRDHYKPVGQGDEVPTAPVTVAVSLADKLDTIGSFFYGDMPPTGSKDPFALRRAALGVIALVVQNSLRLRLTPAIGHVLAWYIAKAVSSEEQRTYDMYSEFILADEAGEDPDSIDIDARLQEKRASPEALMRDFVLPVREVRDQILPFFADRLKVQQREAGVRHDLIDAVFALGGEDDLVRLLARVKALQAFVATEDGANLLAGYKRAANILKKEGYTPDPAATPFPLSYTPEKAETRLLEALDAAEPRAADAIAREDFEGAMAALASLREPIDAFFDDVTVNDPDPAKRSARLAMLARVRDAAGRVADFSRIEG